MGAATPAANAMMLTDELEAVLLRQLLD